MSGSGVWIGIFILSLADPILLVRKPERYVLYEAAANNNLLSRARLVPVQIWVLIM